MRAKKRLRGSTNVIMTTEATAHSDADDSPVRPQRRLGPNLSSDARVSADSADPKESITDIHTCEVVHNDVKQASQYMRCERCDALVYHASWNNHHASLCPNKIQLGRSRKHLLAILHRVRRSDTRTEEEEKNEQLSFTEAAQCLRTMASWHAFGDFLAQYKRPISYEPVPVSTVSSRNKSKAALTCNRRKMWRRLRKYNAVPSWSKVKEKEARERQEAERAKELAKILDSKRERKPRNSGPLEAAVSSTPVKSSSEPQNVEVLEPWDGRGAELHPASTADPRKMRRLLPNDTQLEELDLRQDFDMLGIHFVDEV